MTRPRAALVSVADTPCYHCIGRCVRRAFLCDQDPVSAYSGGDIHRLRHVKKVGVLCVCSSQSCVPRMHEVGLHLAASILDARL